MNEQTKFTQTETPRLYGELFYSADAVRALLHYVAGQLEGPQRAAVLSLSSNIPSTMPWAGNSPDNFPDPGTNSLSRPVHLWIRDDSLFRSGPIRLTCLLRNGPSPMRQDDREYCAGLADQFKDATG